MKEGHVGAVMGAYNRIYGTPSCASPLLLSNLLRGQWGFKGHVVSDCGAIQDFFYGHGFSPTIEAASATAVRTGCDLCCGMEYRQLADAVGDRTAQGKRTGHGGGADAGSAFPAGDV